MSNKRAYLGQKFASFLHLSVLTKDLNKKYRQTHKMAYMLLSIFFTK